MCSKRCQGCIIFDLPSAFPVVEHPECLQLPQIPESRTTDTLKFSKSLAKRWKNIHEHTTSRQWKDIPFVLQESREPRSVWLSFVRFLHLDITSTPCTIPWTLPQAL